MFDDKYKQPIPFFSTQHIIALLVVFALIILIFVFRKFFIKYSLADKIFRYSLASIMAILELIFYLLDGVTPIVDNFLQSIPLCRMLLWITVIVLFSDNIKLEKLIYPLAITGALLSLFIVDMEYSFPHFMAIKFFITHSFFLFAALYYFFTRKISRYTIKDLGNSCITLLLLSSITLVLEIASGDISDPYFIISPPKALKVIKDSLGQVGYTICFILSISLVQLAIYGITYLLTKNRTLDDDNIPKFKQNKILDKFSSTDQRKRIIVFMCIIFLSIYITSLANVTGSIFLAVIDIIMFFVLITMFVLSGVVYNYKKYFLNFKK